MVSDPRLSGRRCRALDPGEGHRCEDVDTALEFLRSQPGVNAAPVAALNRQRLAPLCPLSGSLGGDGDGPLMAALGRLGNDATPVVRGII